MRYRNDGLENGTNAPSRFDEKEIMQIDVSNALGRQLLAEQIASDIDAYCAKNYDDGPRRHLGASVIGHACDMYLWLSHRWCHEEKTYTEYSTGKDATGRIRRLFKRGHWEEPHWIEWLRGTGWIIQEYEPEKLFYHPESDSLFYENFEYEPEDALVKDVTGVERFEALAILRKTKHRQIRISFAENHGGGSLDAECAHEKYTLGEIFLGEFKTYNEKRYNKLVKDGVEKESQKYWAQMCVYGVKRKIRYAIFMAICKNDDRIHIEVKELDWRLGEEMLRKGTQIILLKTPPQRLSDNPAWGDCKMCGKWGVCHGGEPVDINCRSCRHAEPREAGEWFCLLHNDTIPPDFIPKACDKHFPIIGPQK